MDEDAGTGEADLARVVVLLDRQFRGQLEISVGEHDERALAAQFEAARGEIVRGGLRDGLGGRHRAGEGYAAESGMGDERSTRLVAKALHDVERAVRQAGFLRDVGEQRRGERSPLGRLQNHGVARGQCRCDLPGRKHERRVPWSDECGDSGRIPGYVVGVAARLEVRVTEVVDQPVGEEAEVVCDPGHDSAKMAAQQCAVVHGLDVGQLRDILVDQLGDAVHHGRALQRWHRSPHGESGLCRGDREVDLALPAPGDVAEEAAVDWRVVAEGGLGGDARSPDVVPRVDTHPGHIDTCHVRSFPSRTTHR